MIRPEPPVFLQAYQPHLRYYLVDEARYTDQELATRRTPLSGVFGIEKASRNRQSLQRAVDRVVTIIRADPQKERTDAIVTRWLKRHLQQLGAHIDLEKLNSLVEERDMLAENLEHWAKIERQEGRLEGERRVLQRQLVRRFGELPAWAAEKLEAASAEQLDIWADDILAAQTLDELFGR
ncbi:DUF4351 domain-containing protein [Kineobactrum sediminis]|uniref:DUF4351 domain-containing protein n=1 Tax=Kineobactrum sediminis TaxID=1905677 RepID=UPI002409C5B0|nr:DUF4351 domain-containing protein [Kineobactrum sediminis]